MKKRMYVLLALAAAFLIGCGNKESGTGGEISLADTKEEGSKEDTKGNLGELEKELIVYGSCEEDYLAAACKNFEKLYGVKVSYQRLSTGEVYAKIKEEKGKPSADVWFGGTTDPYNEAKNDGLLYAYTPENAVNLKSEVYKDPDGYWHGIYSGYLGFICNKEELDRLNLPVPQDWDDLMAPMYKGMIAFSNPGTSGTGKQFINMMVMLYDKDEQMAMEYFKALDENIVQYPKSGAGPSKLVGPGEIVIAVGFLHDGIKQIIDGYDNLVLIGPASGTSFEVGATAIFEGAEHMEAAKAFVNYALSPDCQELGKENSSYQFLTVTTAKDPEEAAQVADTKLMDYDFQWAGENAARLVELWSESIHADERLKTE